MNVSLVGGDVNLCMVIFLYVVCNTSMFLCVAVYSIENIEF